MTLTLCYSFQRLVYACEEGRIREVDGVLEKWRKERHNINQPNEVAQYMQHEVLMHIVIHNRRGRLLS